MAKPELRDHRKFRKLLRILQEPLPHVRGYLECLWECGYQTGSAFIGDSLDIEAAAMYPGEPGRFTEAAAESGFIDRDDDGNYSIHDLWDHAPRYAKLRMERKGNRPNERTERAQISAEVPEARTDVRENDPNALICAPEPKPKAENREPRTENPNQDGKAVPQSGTAAAAVLTPAEFQEEWNTIAATKGWKRCERMTPDRAKHLVARMRDPHWRENWRTALIRAGPIAGLRGVNDRKWRANIDWFLKPATVARVIEGGYDDWGKDESGGTHQRNRTPGRIHVGDDNDGQPETGTATARPAPAGSDPEAVPPDPAGDGAGHGEDQPASEAIDPDIARRF